MNRDELLAALQASRAEMEASLAGLTDAQLTEPGAMGEWTVKDLLAHLTVWEVELVTALGKFQRGQKPGPLPWTDAEVNALNDKWYHDFKARPLDRVLADWRAVRRQTLRQVERLSDAALNEPRKWLHSQSLFEMINGETLEHEAEHLPHIREWRKRAGY